MVPHALGSIIYALERKEGNLKQTPRSCFTLSQAYELRLTCQNYFKLMTFRIQWEGLHKILD